ncbi:MAG TPA: thioesterase family protein [Streptosporangiaceae bacterium]|jgi:acyl-CoA thioester hydrolase
MGEIFTYRNRVRYYETDQQGVVFNMWYMGYLDEAMNAFLDARGPGYGGMLALGCDVQLVHSELDWRSALRWREEADIDVRPSQVGTTSFTLDYTVRRAATVTEDGSVVEADGAVLATGRTVYVTVATDGGGKIPVPPELRAALEPLEPLV